MKAASLKAVAFLLTEVLKPHAAPRTLSGCDRLELHHFRNYAQWAELGGPEGCW